MTGKSRENYNRNYLRYVNSFDPPTKHFKTCLRAFLVGGFICTIGQFFRFMLEYAGLEGDMLAGTVSAILIFLGTFLTGLGVYDRIGKNAGAGSIVPITGFANSVASRHRVQDGGLRLWHGGENVHRRRSHHRVRRLCGGGRRPSLLAPFSLKKMYEKSCLPQKSVLK